MRTLSVWRSLEKDFRDIPDVFGDLRADWSHQPEFPNQWRLAGGLSPLCRKRFEAVATIAGKRLLTLAGVVPDVSSGIVGTPDPLTVWLTALRERTGQFEMGPCALLQDEQGRTIGHLLMGTIHKVIEVSALLCLQLACEESSTDSIDIGLGSSRPNNLSAPPPSAIEDRKFAQLAIEEARKSVPEGDGRSHPKVGAVVIKGNQVIAQAHRGEIPGCHAEYIALERKLADDSLIGTTVYTTLEPCTARNHPKVPCARRIVERKVNRVVIGMLDPNPSITGRGQLMLRDANIMTDLFPHDLMSEVEELNRDFTRQHRT
jgi:pyrimidine deaminase RibD-like protein